MKPNLSQQLFHIITVDRGVLGGAGCAAVGGGGVAVMDACLQPHLQRKSDEKDEPRRATFNRRAH